MFENVILILMIKCVDVVVEKVVKEVKDGNLKGGKIEEFGLKDDGIGILKIIDNVKKVNFEILIKVEEFEKKIIVGEIKVLVIDKEYKEYEVFLKK